MKINERTWSGHIISWIKEAINNGTTIFEEATNDIGLKVNSGKTKFPDILLFTDKTSGVVFNGWELKFPDTSIDDNDMLINALEKAERLNSNSFVTWNGTEAIIWKINNNYNISSLERLKYYPKELQINTRDDLSDINNYNKHEAKLKLRLNEILHDLAQLYKNGQLKNAINISSNIIEAVKETADKIIPQLKNKINDLKGSDSNFRNNFNKWKIYESSTLNILTSSSRRVESIVPEDILAKFIFYKLIGKILFYQTLSENLSARVDKLVLTSADNIKEDLDVFFNQAKTIDYQAVFEEDFTDSIPFNEIVSDLLFRLIGVFNKFDFKVLPTEVIGHILENLVPNEEKQKFGQYFTSEILASLVTFSAIRTRDDILIDPTSGTGTFLNSFYNALRHFGNESHQQILNQIWGNDISHFPATLSVINLYKQKVNDIANFPRVIRKDYFTLKPNQKIPIPDNIDIDKINEVPIPKFDAIISNFPFIQQEDIPKEGLKDFFKDEFRKTQQAFLNRGAFDINGKSDYYIYCFYNSLKFLKRRGIISVITSNAWLGKNYGLQFKQFLLDNFHIKYIVKSNAEHWFKDSKVSTIFITIEKGASRKETKFITLNNKLEDLFLDAGLQQFEDFYVEIDNCDNPNNNNWVRDSKYSNLYHKRDKTVSVNLVDNNILINSLNTQENWDSYFDGRNPIELFHDKLINPFPSIYDTGRGTRTGWDPMYIIPKTNNLPVETACITPYLKSPTQLSKICINNNNLSSYIFTCFETEEDLQIRYPKSYSWIKKFENSPNKNNTKTIKQKGINENHKPYWYSIKPNLANIVIAINPFKRLFFSYTDTQFATNQRLTSITVKEDQLELVAALLNSVVSLLIVELNGVSRNLGALDLNANFFKTKMRIFDPSLLTNEQKENIINKFRNLSNRKIKNYDEEYNQKDRIEFDEEILRAYGFDTSILPNLYKLLTETIYNRVEMKNK